MVQSASEKVLVRQTYDGMPLVDGFAKGEAVVLKPVGQFEIVLSNDVKFETDRFRCAVLTLESELSALLKTKIAEEQKRIREEKENQQREKIKKLIGLNKSEHDKNNDSDSKESDINEKKDNTKKK